MSEIQQERTKYDVQADLYRRVEEIQTLGELLSEIPYSNIPDGVISMTGHLIIRLADEAKSFAVENPSIDGGAS